MEINELTFDKLPAAVAKLFEKLEHIERLLLEKDTTPTAESEQLLSIQQTADLLCLSKPTIYGLVSRGDIPCMKKGKRLYFSQSELLAWIKSGRKKTRAQIEEEAKKYTNGTKRREVYDADKQQKTLR